MTITVAFYKGRRAENPAARAFDRLVCWWPRSRGRFSHSELVLARRGSLGWCWSSSGRDDGVRGKWIDMTSGRWVVVVLPHYDPAPALTWFHQHAGAPFDFPGILGYVVPIVKHWRRWWYCSEACAAALTLSARASSDPALPLAWPPDTDIPPNALYAWCIAQPGAQVHELPFIETAKP